MLSTILFSLVRPERGPQCCAQYCSALLDLSMDHNVEQYCSALLDLSVDHNVVNNIVQPC